MLASEVARGLDELRSMFGDGVAHLTDLLAMGMPDTVPERRTAAARELAMLAWAILIARADGPETAQVVLDACRGGQAAG